jgi:hypothetical protein
MSNVIKYKGNDRVKVIVDIDRYQLDGTLDSVVGYLAGLGVGLEDPTLDLSVHEGPYYDPIVVEFTLTGYREPTEEELTAHEKKKVRDAEAAKKRAEKEKAERVVKRQKDAEKALKLARKEFPELFKE